MATRHRADWNNTLNRLHRTLSLVTYPHFCSPRSICRYFQFMRQTRTIYMFAFMPPEPKSITIHNHRLGFAEDYNFKRALKPPVHITLLDPFFIDNNIVQAFERSMKKLQSWAEQQSSFLIELQDFGFFENPSSPVVYINVLRNEKMTSSVMAFLTA